MDNNKIKTVKRFINRKRKLQQRLEDFECMMLGMRGGYIAEACDDKGELTFYPSYTEDLIEYMTESISEIRAYKRTVADEKSGDNIIMTSLSDKEKDFYKSFFYLMFGVSLFIPPFKGNWRYNLGPGTFEVVINNIKTINTGNRPNKWYEDQGEMNKDIIVLQEMPEFSDKKIDKLGVLYDILCAYRYVTGKLFSEEISGTQRDNAILKMNDIERMAYDEIEHVNESELKRDIYLNYSILTPEQMEQWNSRDINSFGEVSKVNEINNGKISDWKKYFDDEKRLESSIKIFMEGIFDPSIRADFEGETSNMTVILAVELGMAKCGVTDILHDDIFFPAYTYLNKAYNAAYQWLNIDIDEE
ncbi:hypothetical protein [Butyrivibrio sp. AE2015]|uniref:hypothetical protein n=1 Tax=Butyrivibrio sp. AE2015 TaxID=1280663 RepID=UPI0003B35C1E|nr:hypothetical protein [Butyrivibrio sp. AE2015]